MSADNCICGTPAALDFGNPGCNLEMKQAAFPLFMYRYKADGTRNSIDVSSATLGADIVAKLATSTDIIERLFPTTKVRNQTVPRTDTEYETTSNGDKFTLDGQGGIYSFLWEYYEAGAAFAISRQFQKMGCAEIDMYIVDIAGNIWGTKTSDTATDLYGYKLSKSTIENFYSFAVPGNVGKNMFSVDLDAFECVENSYAITSAELVDTGGISGTDIVPLTAGYQTLTAVSNTTFQTVVYMSYGSAGTRKPITGLAPASAATNFTAYDETADAAVPLTSAVESPDGTYLITTTGATTATNIIRIEVAATGFDVADATVAAVV